MPKTNYDKHLGSSRKAAAFIHKVTGSCCMLDPGCPGCPLKEADVDCGVKSSITDWLNEEVEHDQEI